MSVSYLRDLGLLFVGDLVVLFGSLWLALVARHFVAPNSVEYFAHAVPFAGLFVLALIVFAIVGLYDRTTALFEDRLPQVILEAQVVNLAIALGYFFLAPIAIQPKTILALYFVVSTLLIVIWRLGIFRLRSLGRPSYKTVLVGEGSDILELRGALESAPHTRIELVAFIDSAERTPAALTAELVRVRAEQSVELVILDPRLGARGVHVPPELITFDASELYESLLGRVALSLTNERDLTPYLRATGLYWFLKRVIDIALSLVLLIGILIIFPFVYLAVRLESKGPLCIAQDRIGKGWKPIRVYKFRTMTKNEHASGAWVGESENKVTKVGAFLRRTSIDELPQVLSVFWGDLSLIGPRSDIVGLGERLREEIPLYEARYRVTPGISGWAQVNQHYAPGNISPQSIEESRVRLMYDLYYVKYHSLLLDISITLKTVRTLLGRLFP